MKEELMNEELSETIPMFKFQEEPLTQTFIDEHHPLYIKHCAEVGWFKQDDPDMLWRDYWIMASVGMVRIFTLRDNSSKLVGYGIYFVRQNLHYQKVKVAMCDMIYVEPDHRGGTGEHFISRIDSLLKKEGVNAVTHHAKKYFDFGGMLKRLEYEHVENIYIRRLN